MKCSLFALIGLCMLGTASAQELTGDWNAILDISGQQLPLVFHIESAETGHSGTLDSPKQGAFGIAMDQVRIEQDSLIVRINRIGMTYKGKRDADGAISGTFQQGPITAPLLLTRGEATPPPPKIRPQNPVKPYPYTEEFVTFDNPTADLTLAGTLTLPEARFEKAKGFPAVILISGSGPQDRDESLLGHKPFLVLADYLTRQGIAVLRYDDRGTAESTGNFKGATSVDFATDAQAAFDFLKTHEAINPKQIGFAGHSEGGFIAPMVAAKNKEVAFIALLAGVGQPGAELLADQGYLIGKAQGMSEEVLQKNKTGAEYLFDLIKKNPGDEALLKEKATAYLKQAFEENPELLPEGVRSDQMIEQQLSQLLTPWFQYFIASNPEATLQQVDCPVLAINGSLDLQVPASKNLTLIKRHVLAGGNTDVTTVEIPQLNHLFQTATTGSPSEYAAIEETFAPVALAIIGDWIAKKTN